jgi:hypothetical protein
MQRAMSPRQNTLIAFAMLSVASLAPAQATASTPTAMIVSMGQPLRWQPYAAALGSLDRDGQLASSLLAGIHHPLTNPVTGLAGISAETYGNAGGAFAGIGTRLLAASPVLGLGAGVDWNVSRTRADFLLTWHTAIRRGGLLGRGTTLRLDYLPTRGRSLGVGVQAPLLQPFAGRTRPRQTRAPLSRIVADEEQPRQPPIAAVDTALAAVRRAAAQLCLYTSVYSRDDARRLRMSDSYASVMRAYADGLTRAFAAAAGDDTMGTTLASRARAGLLDSALLPYDALFGQVKDGAEFPALLSAARASFARWLRDSSRVSAATRRSVSDVHSQWLEILLDVQRDLGEKAKDSRLVWLPLRLALTPDQYDEQTEVDSLLARIVGRPFTDQNALTMLRSADLPLEIARSIHAAREYHVLWTHDIAGRVFETREIDNVAYSMVADAYLPALTAAVKRYDATGKLPVYMILVDQFFYEPSDGRLWLTMLENPLGVSMHVPGDASPENAARESHLRERQAELRAAVAASSRLQADARRSGVRSNSWIEREVKIHVSITQPSDFSFRSRRIVPPFPFAPDNLMRDHRKIVLYDLDEADPYRGAMILMGIGIGEHFASMSWEDRGYRIRGPATLEARNALRRLLALNGFGDSDIPAPLREVASAKAREFEGDDSDYVGRALQVHNEPGFGAKQSSVTRAMLYDLAQPGAVVVVPDPLWLSAEWAAMLAGASARGAKVYVIAPALANAPSPDAAVMSLAHDVMLRVLELRTELDMAIRGAGGDLRVALFAAHAQVDDGAARRREVRDGLQRAPWIRDLIPFDARTLAVLDRAEAQTASDEKDAVALASHETPRPPQLHQKTQLIARPGAIAALVRQPGWDDVLAQTMRAQSQQTARFADQLGWMTPDLDTTATRGTDALLRGYERAVPEGERKQVSFYFTLATQNQDPRGMMLDGESTVIVSGFYATAGLVDTYYLMARSTWITTSAELDYLLPPVNGWMRALARLLRAAM